MHSLLHWTHTCVQIQLLSREVCVLYQHVYSLTESKTRRARRAYTTGREVAVIWEANLQSDTEVRSGSDERREHLQEFINRRYCRSSIIIILISNQFSSTLPVAYFILCTVCT